MNTLPISEIDVSIDPEFSEALSEDWLLAVLQEALSVAAPGGEPYQVSLMVTGDDTVRRLNQQYRGLDEVTDVLSFSAEHSGHWEGEDEANYSENQLSSASDGIEEEGDIPDSGFVLPPGELQPLGEVIISFPQTARQSQERMVPFDRELALLVVHGVLHLTGHDHLEPEETSRMRSQEQKALDSLFPPETNRI